MHKVQYVLVIKVKMQEKYDEYLWNGNEIGRYFFLIQQALGTYLLGTYM